ncbi:MAG: hypothetical protein Q8R28_11125 [Dehalococcoidia bacterium]|nr:hypothetical protein [Dehalococcoidia bacterium]
MTIKTRYDTALQDAQRRGDYRNADLLSCQQRAYREGVADTEADIEARYKALFAVGLLLAAALEEASPPISGYADAVAFRARRRAALTAWKGVADGA